MEINQKKQLLNYQLEKCIEFLIRQKVKNNYYCIWEQPQAKEI